MKTTTTTTAKDTYRHDPLESRLGPMTRVRDERTALERFLGWLFS